MSLIIGGLLLALAAPGCALSIGGGDTEIIHKETLGRELLDLKDARDRGALSEVEYEKARRDLIRATLPAGANR